MLASAFFMASELRWNSAVFRRNSLHFYPAINNRCVVQPKVKVLHIFRKAFPYKVTASNEDFNLIRMAYSHFSEERIEKCKKYIRSPEKTDELVKSVLESGALEQREKYLSKRKRDDDWFFKYFNINF
ncbi:hypothetical protein T458_05930 [Brevibacillus panacihumi W25]|uniref:Uncharacterized protein n=1 Tax=Brevibacillus panacihumi W25 TaxID=1408254 RepID=V6MAU3_9BACL|nr:hypothetical protein [Brevibacillus panacihumi]EST55639.1 hypothetical protein T458_05930 [Brevibacillus panacihumi W25]